MIDGWMKRGRIGQTDREHGPIEAPFFAILPPPALTIHHPASDTVSFPLCTYVPLPPPPRRIIPQHQPSVRPRESLPLSHLLSFLFIWALHLPLLPHPLQ
ncbi:unnamed protein product [Pleuronectes platessa]|uniref:Uncharacterized protein n=1 Tax=Pleuronectes platessa TaxID=8262 RepID=A0A9N7VGV8_PLEPL|nr:unnamed protein product [Pleuronectes platessa]